VIRSFRNRETEKVFRREFSRRFQSISRIAKRKLDHIHAAGALADLERFPATGWNSWEVIVKGNIAFGSTTNGGFAFGGPILTLLKSRLRTTIKE
jgi:hypothetical protein